MTMYVVRVGNDGYSYRNSKPCAECAKFMKEFFPGKIIYSGPTDFILERIASLESNHLSHYQREMLGSSDSDDG